MECSLDRMTALGPIVRWSWSMASHVGGWTIEARHAHVAGLLVDCPPFRVESLSFAELSDVLCVLMDEIGANAGDFYRA